MLHLGPTFTLPTIAIRAISGSDGAAWGSSDLIEGKPVQQFMGIEPGSVSLSLFLHVEFCRPLEVIEALTALAQAGVVVDAWTDDGRYWGARYLSNLSWQHSWTLPAGQVLAATCSVTLNDPGEDPYQVVTPQPPGLAAFAQAEEVAPLPEFFSADPASVSQGEIVRR